MLTRRRFAQALSLSLTLAVTLLAFTSHWGVEAKPVQGAGSPLSQIPIHIKLPDIETSIAAFSDCDSTQIYNGYFPNCCSSARVRFTIKNKGTATAKNFFYKVVIRNNGVKVYD